MSYYNINCTITARSCVSGCCQLGGSCATLPSNCRYTYSDFYSNPSKYYYPGYAHSSCSSLSKNCTSGCCKTGGSCALS